MADSIVASWVSLVFNGAIVVAATAEGAMTRGPADAAVSVRATELAVAMAKASGRVRVTVLGELFPASAQTVQIFSTVVMGMLAVSMMVESIGVHPHFVVVREVGMVV